MPPSGGDPWDSILTAPPTQAAPSVSTPSPTARVVSQRRTPTRFQQAGTPQPANTPELSVGQTLQGAAQNFLPSAGQAIGSIASAVTHPGETLSAIGNLGRGFLTQGANALGLSDPVAAAESAIGVKDDPNASARSLALARSLEQHYAQTYGSVKGFKQALATDPASILMDASTVLDVAGAAADAARLGSVASALRTTAGYANPIGLAAKGVGALGKAAVANPLTRTMQSAMTGVPQTLLRTAAIAGSETNPALRATFYKWFNGGGDPVEFLQRAQQAVRGIKQDASDAYLARKGALASDQVPLTNTAQAFQDAAASLNQGSTLGFPQAKAALVNAQQLMSNLHGTDIANIDALKQQIWDLKDVYKGDRAPNVLNDIYHGLRADMGAVDPNYLKLMDQWQESLNNIRNISGTTGTGARNPVAGSVLAKTLRSIKTPNGQNVLSQLQAKDPQLPYMLAGDALSRWNSGPAHTIVSELMEIPLAAATHGNPIAMGAGLIGGFAGASPKIAGYLNAAPGTIGRVGSQFAGYGRAPYYAGRVQQEDQNPSAPTAQGTANPDATWQKMLNVESGNRQFDKYGKPLVSRAGAVGKAQVLPKTGPQAASLAGEAWDPDRLANDPAYNERLGRAYYDHLLQEFGDPELAAAAYNGGEGRVRNAMTQANTTGRDWREFLRPETQRYVRLVSASGGRIQLATGGKADDIASLVERLLEASRKAMTEQKKATKPLLSVPDDTVAKALAVAQRAI